MNRPAHTLLAILAGAALLAWPALLNGYPIMFTDTYGYLEQGYEGVAWDKPWIYGPLTRALHWGRTLWPIIAAQALLLSTMLWLTQRVLLPTPRRTGHVALCTLLAIGSAAPWFAAFAMPDNLTPIVALGLFILAFGRPNLSARTLLAVGLITTTAIAAHLSHLIMAASVLAIIAILRWRTLLRDLRRPALPLAAALAIILATNVIGRGITGISPTGSVFALARLVTDGPAARYLESACPAANYRLCAWVGHFPTDSDEFLWASDGPMYKDGFGAERLAPEAAAIIRHTISAYPAAVLASVARNTIQQLSMVRLGDTIGPDYLDKLVRDTIIAYLPPAELARFESSLQYRGKLKPIGEAFNGLHLTLLALGAAATLAIAARRIRPTLAAFALVTLTATIANAFATGALSGPHDRYQARIAWLVLLPPALTILAALKQPRPNAPSPRHPATDGSSAG